MNASASATTATSASPHPPPYTASRAPDREDWEDWEDDEPITPIDAGEQVFIGAPPPPVNSTRRSKPTGPRASRGSVIRIARKSRHRQRNQNAKAGISLITDMTAFGRQTRLLRTPDGRPVKFVDAAALKALEGEPSSASVGNWGWFSKNKMSSPATASPQQLARSPDHGLSPEDRPIVIGISLPSDEMTDREVSPQTATTLQTPFDLQQRLDGFPTPPTSHPSQPLRPLQPAVVPPHQSVWSPDTPTPDTASSFSPGRYTSSIYSQAPQFGSGSRPADVVPPVPTVPANFKKSPHQRLISLELGENAAEESESGTPCTLFEEDGTSSPQKQVKGKTPAVTPDSAGSKSHGWWDHVVTPFVDKRLSFASRKKIESPRDGQEEWRNGSDPKPAHNNQHLTPTLTLVSFQTPIVRAPTPRRTPSPRPETTSDPDSGPSTAVNSPAPAETFPVREKPRIIVTDEVHMEQPPPYSPPEKHGNTAPVRYRAVFPQGHPLNAQFPPSPGPISPGLSATMTSQGATPMTEIPLTPGANGTTPQPQLPLPLRPLGTFVPHSHSQETSGEMTRGERQRRRHEKEEVIARKAGGFWRGRGCISKSGCFGRTGREGRQRRRVWMIVLGVVLCVIILVVTLAVMLTRPKDSEEIPSIWVNLTDFPPMPTGVLTVVGPENKIAKDSCTAPSTLWSCYLPKEQHASVSPYNADQPTVIMQIQWDNSTQDNWNVPNGDAPTPIPRRSVGRAAYASSTVRERGTLEFNPIPDAPDYKEMFFLGNTTDDIQSDEKGGEPTPFYISLLDSLDDVDADELSKRAFGDDVVLPTPDLNEDGTPKPAILLPTPSQQPVRLYDRGLPTEHYGFYTYFKRTIFMRSINATGNGVPLDEEGGCRETEADFLATWSQTRVLVQIWTQTLDSNTSTLLSSSGQSSINETSELIRPGTMPYPVTVTTDTHGGGSGKKYLWAWPMDDRQQLDLDTRHFLANNMKIGGTLINKRSEGDEKYGGFDGGTGGCQCQWVNWVAKTS
ncbi:putative HLH transcription factor [Dactylonectria estremocensis]|uniref:HLH transcription factor n=1 Tax=Dactylonectria estremocensis TaxID=1079267 RepID=A0A9P9JIH7_9HYPO|nr:putative HLH transcription factor [Dactylonectria estremocensis]